MRKTMSADDDSIDAGKTGKPADARKDRASDEGLQECNSPKTFHYYMARDLGESEQVIRTMVMFKGAKLTSPSTQVPVEDSFAKVIRGDSQLVAMLRPTGLVIPENGYFAKTTHRDSRLATMLRPNGLAIAENNSFASPYPARDRNRTADRSFTPSDMRPILNRSSARTQTHVFDDPQDPRDDRRSRQTRLMFAPEQEYLSPEATLASHSALGDPYRSFPSNRVDTGWHAQTQCAAFEDSLDKGESVTTTVKKISDTELYAKFRIGRKTFAGILHLQKLTMKFDLRTELGGAI